MKNKFFKLVSVFILSLFGSSVSAQTHGIDEGNDQEYASDWQKIDSLEKKGLYRMALKEVNRVFIDASENKRHNHVIKAVMFELKYNSYLEEDDYVLGIHKLESLVKKAPSPSKEIFHSLLAEVYWGYYSSNIWAFANRTSVVDVDLTDIRTWDLKRIAHKIRFHYQQSLLNDAVSKTASIKDFTEIVLDIDQTILSRPTLYDFLGHRALDFFVSNTFELGGSADAFVIEDTDFFGSNSVFVKSNAISQDSLNTKFLAIQVFRLLTDFHLSQNNRAPLFALSLERLEFCKNNAVNENKNDLYYAGVKQLAESFKTHDFASEAYYAMAKYTFYQNDYTNGKSKIAYEICQKTIEKYPGSFGARQCASLVSDIERKELSIVGENAVIPNTISKVLINYKNIDQVSLKIVKIDQGDDTKIKYNSDRLLKQLRKGKAIYEKQISLENPGDYNLHNVEVMIPELEHGLYYIVLSTDGSYDNESGGFTYMQCWSTSITYQSRNINNGYNEVLVSDRKTGEPINHAKVEVFYEKYNNSLRRYEHKSVGKFETDNKGVVRFSKGEEYRNYYLKISHNKEVYYPNEGIYAYRHYPEEEVISTNFFTDRKIYRPGQKIFYKGIVVKHAGKDRILMKNYPATVAFYDANGQEVEVVEVMTNKFGSFEGEFTAPFGVLTGLMRITDGNGYTEFRVEEYKRPKFGVTMNPVAGEFKVNDIVSATGVAEAFAGNKIDGAEVNYRVVRSVSYNDWGWWYRYSVAEPKEIAKGELVTDGNGEFEIRFKALPDRESDPKGLPVFSYTVYVDVTDINGETRSTSQNISVGYHSLLLGQNLTEDMNNSKSFVLKMGTTNLNGQKISAAGEIKIDKLVMPDKPFYARKWSKPDMQSWSEEEFKKLYPLEAYQDEDQKYNWAVEKTVFDGKFNTAQTDSVVLADYNEWEAGMYKYEAIATDKRGIEVKDVFYFTVFSPKSKVSPANDLLWIKNLNPTAEPGDEVEILLASLEKNLIVRYDVEVNGKFTETKNIKLSKEQKKLTFKVEESYRGNFTVHFTVIKHNRHLTNSSTIVVPYTNKQLDLSFATFRNKLLPGQEEEWILTIKNKYGGKEQAELLASLYDASLDPLYTPNAFYMNLYKTFYGSKGWGVPSEMSNSSGSNRNYYWNKSVGLPYRAYPSLNYFNWYPYYYYNGYSYDMDGAGYELMESEVYMDIAEPSVGQREDQGRFLSANKEVSKKVGDDSVVGLADDTKADNNQSAPPEKPTDDLSGVAARTNFNETAFFFPQLTTDRDGNVQIKFTIPESLTKWRFLGLAHTEDLKVGAIQEEIVTQKELMVVPNMPRFFREGDEISISAKISNISEKDLEGKAQLVLLDPFTEENIDAKFDLTNSTKEFATEKGLSTVVTWSFKIPYETSAVKYRIVASAASFSDGEENVLPILSNRMLVTESLPMPIRGNQSKTFKFDKLTKSNQSTTLRHHRFTLEFTSNPAWYAVQAIPYMMENPHECAEQTFTRYYSNAIASHIMHSNPKIKEVIDAWANESPDAFLSNLQKNEELKAVILEETPWVLDAQNEEQSKRNLAVLLDMNRMSTELEKALGKLMQMQSSNGGWPWFPGMRENRYITQHIVTGLGHLDHIGVKDQRENNSVWRMLMSAIKFLDGEIVSDYKSAKKYDKDYLKNQHIGYNQIQYLYARSYFPDVSMDNSTKEAVVYYKEQATKFWLEFNVYAEGMIALAAHRFEMSDLALDIVKSLKDRSIQNEEFGMYWKEYSAGYYWYQAPIETQALMIEVFNDITNDQTAVDELKIWLLKQKQTTNWKTTKQTTEAVYALLLTGGDLLASDERVEITLGGKSIEYVDKANAANPYQVKTEAGTGYFKTAWKGNAISPEMGDIKVSKKDKGVAWGAAYWQYFEDLDKITYAETNLKLKKDLFLVELSNEGEQLRTISDQNELTVGEKVRVRIELRTDRNLEYVHMKDMRAAGFEPLNVLSYYRYQGGLGYYQSTKDAATHFYFDYIPKGTYVFEYDLRVQHKGDFSNGIATIQCMYAPEFTSHSDGIRVSVK